MIIFAAKSNYTNEKMKKILLTGSLLLLCSLTFADDSSKTNVDGTKVRKITFDGDQITIKYNDGTSDATYDMADVMISFSNATSIQERIAIARKTGLEGEKIYTLKGEYVGNSVARLRPGLYIIKNKKVIIK